MVRIIGRTDKNKENFDKLWERSQGHRIKQVWPSGELLVMFAQILGVNVNHPVLGMAMHN